MKVSTIIFAYGILVTAADAHAAPLCLDIQGIAPQCQFVDPDQCNREARRQHGRCILNPAEPMQAIGTSPYCAAESGILSCVYGDRASCMSGAGGQRLCVPALPRPYPILDPYDPARPYY